MGYFSEMFIERTAEDDRLDRMDGIKSVVYPSAAHPLYCIVYRTGGTDNFRWHRTLAMPYEEAKAALKSTARMGYRCHMAIFSYSIAIGLPETYE